MEHHYSLSSRYFLLEKVYKGLLMHRYSIYRNFPKVNALNPSNCAYFRSSSFWLLYAALCRHHEVLNVNLAKKVLDMVFCLSFLHLENQVQLQTNSNGPFAQCLQNNLRILKQYSSPFMNMTEELSLKALV